MADLRADTTIGGKPISSVAYGEYALSFKENGNLLVTIGNVTKEFAPAGSGGSTISFIVHYELTDCTSSNTATTINHGDSYTTTLSVAAPRTLQTVTIIATLSDGSYYFKPACENRDISSYIFSNINVKYIRIKAYRNSKTEAITPEYGARIILKQQ